jgi:hypothetical protein
MNLISQLGRHTAQKTAATKQAVIGKALGGLADNLVGGAARLVGRGFAAKNPLVKTLTGAGTVGALGIGGAAANEGLARMGGGLQFDGDPTWSPHLQSTRQFDQGIGGNLMEFLKRPIQSTFNGRDPIPDAAGAMTGGIPKGLIKGFKLGPDGKVTMDVGGSATAPLAPSYLRMLQKLQGLNQTLGIEGLGGNKPSTPAKNNGQVQYIFGAPQLPSTSTF